MTTYSFGSWNQWIIPGSDFRTQFWIKNSDTVYATYVDVENMKWCEGLWKDNKKLGHT